MSSQIKNECCFINCSISVEKPDLQIKIYALEEGSSIFWSHKKCFTNRRDPSVTPDNQNDHGRIPKEARCMFCGKKLPVFGKHPYCFDVGESIPPLRYWAHNECMKENFSPGIISAMPF
jgi:hypothetical protein